MWEANEQPNDHDKEHLTMEEDVLAFVNTSIINTSIASSTAPNVPPLDAKESQRANEELWDIHTWIDLLSPYSFVGQIKDLVEKRLIK